jgi:cupin 2 domain-containing protein
MRLPSVNNILAVCSADKDNEKFFPLLTTPTVTLEKIESHGCATPEGYWYDQVETEWVMLVTGSAMLAFESGKRLALTAGDYITLPPHCKHRVEQCSEDALWLALHAR